MALERLLVFSRHVGAAASGDASPLDRMDVSRSGANSQALRKGRSPGRVLHRRAVVAGAGAGAAAVAR